MNYSEKSVSLVLNRDRFCSIEDIISFESTVQSVGAIAQSKKEPLRSG